MNTEFAFEIMERITPDVVEILNDPAVQGVKLALKEGNISPIESIRDLYPALFTAHKDAMYNIIAATAGKTVDEIKAQPFSDTVTVLRDGFVDEMLGFFVSWLRMVLKA